MSSPRVIFHSLALFLSLMAFDCPATDARESWRCALDLVDNYDSQIPEELLSPQDAQALEYTSTSPDHQFAFWFGARTRHHDAETRKLAPFLAKVIPAERRVTPGGRERLEMKFHWERGESFIEMALPSRYQHTLVYYTLLAYQLERYLQLADASQFVRGDYFEGKVYAIGDFLDLIRWEYVLDKKAIRNEQTFLRHIPSRVRQAWAERLQGDAGLDPAHKKVAIAMLENADLSWEEYWSCNAEVGRGSVQALLLRDKNIASVAQGERYPWPVTETERGELLRTIEEDEAFNLDEQRLLIDAVNQLTQIREVTAH